MLSSTSVFHQTGQTINVNRTNYQREITLNRTNYQRRAGVDRTKYQRESGQTINVGKGQPDKVSTEKSRVTGQTINVKRTNYQRKITPNRTNYQRAFREVWRGNYAQNIMSEPSSKEPELVLSDKKKSD